MRAGKGCQVLDLAPFSWLIPGILLAVGGMPAAGFGAEGWYSETALPPGAAQPTLSSPLSQTAERQLVTWMEKLLPVLVQVFDERLALMIEAVGERKLTRKYTEQEFEEFVVNRVPELFPGQISEMSVRIHPEGFIGSAKLHTGSQTFEVTVRLGIEVKNHRPHTVIQEVKVGVLAPESLIKQAEMRVNEKIDRTKANLRVNRCELNEGWALISAELAD